MKKKIAITIDDELFAKLLVLAKEDGRNTSNLINKIIKDYIDSKEG